MRYTHCFTVSFVIAALVLLTVPKAGYSAEPDRSLSHLLENPAFFPLGVSLQAPDKASAYKEIGINLYVGLWKGPTSDQLARLKAANMPVFSAQNEVGLTDPNNDMIIGWAQKGEPDNGQWVDGALRAGPPILPAEMWARYEKMRAADPTRPVLLNLGQGVALDHWHGRGPRTNHPEDYEDYVKAADIVSFDIYPVTHRDLAVRGRLDLVAKGVDRLIKWTDGGKPVWAVIGASRIDNPDIIPTKEEVRNQVWLAIIHGAKGIIYFVHQFRPTFIEAALLQHGDLRDAVKAINHRITSLAVILNSESLKDAVSTTNATPRGSGERFTSIASLVKRDKCHLYIFAGSRSKLPGAALFHVKQPDLHPNVVVLDENRSIKTVEGRFRDNFGAYETHLYQLSYNMPDCPEK
ncbi:MAG: hypothetical protein COB93_01605 [Sneathiella sp.]|nr:MAG: hypothetical protein COB93_01605 [Sneathiella sp.]